MVSKSHFLYPATLGWFQITVGEKHSLLDLWHCSSSSNNNHNNSSSFIRAEEHRTPRSPTAIIMLNSHDCDTDMSGSTESNLRVPVASGGG
ncbi:unnamed protein product, partial [Pylaiella littoralis]